MGPNFDISQTFDNLPGFQVLPLKPARSPKMNDDTAAAFDRLGVDQRLDVVIYVDMFTNAALPKVPGTEERTDERTQLPTRMSGELMGLITSDLARLGLSRLTPSDKDGWSEIRAALTTVDLVKITGLKWVSSISLTSNPIS